MAVGAGSGDVMNMGQAPDQKQTMPKLDSQSCSYCHLAQRWVEDEEIHFVYRVSQAQRAVSGGSGGSEW